MKIKLISSSNYRSRKRTIKIALSTKRKLASVHGTLARPPDDPVRGEQWDACNSAVVA